MKKIQYFLLLALPILVRLTQRSGDFNWWEYL